MAPAPTGRAPGAICHVRGDPPHPRGLVGQRWAQRNLRTGPDPDPAPVGAEEAMSPPGLGSRPDGVDLTLGRARAVVPTNKENTAGGDAPRPLHPVALFGACGAVRRPGPQLPWTVPNPVGPVTEAAREQHHEHRCECDRSNPPAAGTSTSGTCSSRVVGVAHDAPSLSGWRSARTRIERCAQAGGTTESKDRDACQALRFSGTAHLADQPHPSALDQTPSRPGPPGRHSPSLMRRYRSRLLISRSSATSPVLVYSPAVMVGNPEPSTCPSGGVTSSCPGRHRRELPHRVGGLTESRLRVSNRRSILVHRPRRAHPAPARLRPPGPAGS